VRRARKTFLALGGTLAALLLAIAAASAVGTAARARHGHVLVDAGVVPDYDLFVRGRYRPLHASFPPVPPAEPVRRARCRPARAP
jgi:hypothetical protein